MTRHIVVGYTATPTGRDAVTFASRLAAASGSCLVIVIVLPSEERSVITPPALGYEQHLRQLAQDWLDEASALVPEGIHHEEQVRYGASFAEGLIDSAHEFSATSIVVGAAGGASLGRHRLGSTTSELLHSADVPVVLVPHGAGDAVEPADGIPRLTVAIGTRPGAEVLLEEGVRLARATGASLRLLSLVTVDLPASVDTEVVRLAGAAHADQALGEISAALPDGLTVETMTGSGSSIQEAVRPLDWMPGEVLLVGSSRLARPRRLFLGSTASKLLREIPVPMVVVPRTRTAQNGAEA